MTTSVSELLDRAVDSSEYEILLNAVDRIVDVDGLTCEIGLREGGASYKIMNRLRDKASVRPHIAIDPYGDIPYIHHNSDSTGGGTSTTGTNGVRLDYNLEMKNRALSRLYRWCGEVKYPFSFYEMEDTEFFIRFSDGVPSYDYVKTLQTQYALVFFDGPHSTRTILAEIDFFKSRTPVGGVWVFDDIDQYPHASEIDPILLTKLGFESLETGSRKASYRRVSKGVSG